MQISC